MSITTVKATFDGQEYTLTFNETTRKYETGHCSGQNLPQ